MSVFYLLERNTNMGRDMIYVDGTPYEYAEYIPKCIGNLFVKDWRIENMRSNGDFDISISTIEGPLTSL